jgi:beta-lactam-binding protein with PASTA domain/predicted Ser/Thr protein kinase
MSEQGPTVFKDRYEVHRKLARGGMSDVYLARDRVLDRPVALKVLFPEYAKDATFVARFRREAQAAARLNHPNIVGVYDWGEETGTYFIAMEYIEGRTLSEIVRAEGPMHPRRAAEVAADTAAALGFAHRNGVIHRDVKPGNVMVETSGLVKVADFGIAQAVGGPEQTQLTRVGSVMGTATYFSPEQAQGRQVDPRSDIYSLGCVLFEILTARPPFTGDTPVAIAYKHVQEAPPHPSEIVQVPPGLDAIVMKCLAKSPDGRYSSSEELRTDLRRFLEGQPVAAMAGVGAATGATAAFGAATGMTPGYDATTALPVTGGYPPATGATGAIGPYGDMEPEKKKLNPWLIGALVVFLLLVAGGLIALAANMMSAGSNTKPVPNVVNRLCDEAKTILVQQGFKGDCFEEPNESGKQPGTVIRQDPEANKSASTDTPVKLYVTAGSATVPMPDVSNKPADQAIAQLKAAGFVVAEPATPETSDTVQVNLVIRTSPAAGQPVPKGSPVTVYVSSGKSTVAVPDVTGNRSETATKTLNDAGFQVNTVQEPSNAYPTPGSVTRTNPAAGAMAPKGAVVTMYVSTGPAPTTAAPTTATPQTTATTKPQSTTTTKQGSTTSEPP